MVQPKCVVLSGVIWLEYVLSCNNFVLFSDDQKFRPSEFGQIKYNVRDQKKK